MHYAPWVVPSGPERQGVGKIDLNLKLGPHNVIRIMIDSLWLADYNFYDKKGCTCFYLLL